jgi:hypothetical protein
MTISKYADATPKSINAHTPHNDSARSDPSDALREYLKHPVIASVSEPTKAINSKHSWASCSERSIRKVRWRIARNDHRVDNITKQEVRESVRRLICTYSLSARQLIDIIETVYRAASKDRGFVVSPKGGCVLFSHNIFTEWRLRRLLDTLPILKSGFIQMLVQSDNLAISLTSCPYHKVMRWNTASVCLSYHHVETSPLTLKI